MEYQDKGFIKLWPDREGELMHQFKVDGDPVPQGRPRVVRTGKFIRFYDLKECIDFKEKVALSAKKSGIQLSLNPLMIDIRFYVKRPLQLMKFSSVKYALPCVKRPDIDNYVKAILDALNGIAYKDDSQICKLVSTKYYHHLDSQPTTYIEISEIISGESHYAP